MNRELENRTVVVTRAADQQGAARELLEQQGASVLDLPALVIGPPDHWGPLDNALEDLDSFDWLVFSSANGVIAVEDRLQRQNRCLAHRPTSLKIAAVGRKTAGLLEKMGTQSFKSARMPTTSRFGRHITSLLNCTTLTKSLRMRRYLMRPLSAS